MRGNNQTPTSNNSTISSSSTTTATATSPTNILNTDHCRADQVLALACTLNQRLCREDLLLHFRLVGLGTAPLLQLPPSLAVSEKMQSASPCPSNDRDRPGKTGADLPHTTHGIATAQSGQVASTPSSRCTINYIRLIHTHISYRLILPSSTHINSIGPNPLRMSALLEGVHLGRVLLLNVIQVGAFLCVSCLSMALWPLLAQVMHHPTTRHIMQSHTSSHICFLLSPSHNCFHISVFAGIARLSAAITTTTHCSIIFVFLYSYPCLRSIVRTWARWSLEGELPLTSF